MARYGASPSLVELLQQCVVRKTEKTAANDQIPCILEPELTGKIFRRNWARLIQKIYGVDPLLCGKCGGLIGVVSVIEDEQVIKRIL